MKYTIMMQRFYISVAVIIILMSSTFAALPKLFSTDVKESQWIQFSAAGFDRPVSGVIYTTDNPPCCGVPLGGIGTGCLDMDVRGVWGFSSVFNPKATNPRSIHWRQPRKLPKPQPILGLSIAGKTWVLASKEFIDGSMIKWCTEPDFHSIDFEGDARVDDYKLDVVQSLNIEGVEPVKKIHYWGHYPVADLEFTTDAPVSVAMRAWAPYLPGQDTVSNTPAAVLEVKLRNISDSTQSGTIAFNFPGPDEQEALSVEFTRSPIKEDFEGILISSTGGVNYVAGVIGNEKVRLGSGLASNPKAWLEIADKLPQPQWQNLSGTKTYTDSSASVAVDFVLPPKENKTVRFLLTWYAPVWEGNNKTNFKAREGSWHNHQWKGSDWAGDTHYFSHMYGVRYNSSLDVARRIAQEHQSLLKRILAWQQVIYNEQSLPVWLLDSLINNLCLIAEDSYWAQAKPPLGDWCFPGGLFALNESPRGCPDLACIPCDWYGNLPIVFFHPQLARTTLRAFKAYQKDDGEIPFLLGLVGDLPDMATPAYYWQVSLNGVCYVDMIDRLWLRTGDEGVLREFYDSMKRCNTFTMNLSTKPGAVIRMPDRGGMEWFEFGEWAGMASHMGGLRLAALRMTERMAEAVGDKDYAAQCRQWFNEGSNAMEEKLWAGNYYLNYWEPETGKKSDDVMGYQLDGQWAAVAHGLNGVFREDRVRTTLDTIRKYNVALTPEIGAANFAHPDGSPLEPKSEVAAYGPYSMFTAEVVVLGMTYLYAGQKEFGLDLIRKHWENLVCRQGHPWDFPNMVRGDTGQRLFGTDYYQVMMLWALPAAMAGQDLAGPTRDGGLVDRVLKAANRNQKLNP